MKRKILIGINETPARLKCKFGAVGCLKEASTKNTFDVPMCKFCFNIWNKLRDNTQTEFTHHKKVQIPISLVSDEVVKTFLKAKSDDEEDMKDEFYCGDY